MSPARDPSVGTYARAIEELWNGRLERVMVFSPRDWDCLRHWYETGVPIQIVAEALDAAIETKRSRPPRNLASLDSAVRHSWSVVVEGRGLVKTDEAEGAPATGGDLLADHWRRAADEGAPDASLTQLLRRLLRLLEEGTPVAVVDRELDDSLLDAVATELLEQAEREVDSSLAGHRGRMSPSTYASTRAAGLIANLRRRLSLPRLSG